MKRTPILMVGLDAFELGIAERLMAQGKLPALRRLKEKGASILLEHGPAKRTGLAWEHVSTGRNPDDSGRWSSVDFNPRTYGITQSRTRLPPFLADLDVSAVVFDAPYFDLERAPHVSGMVSWGAHDPGIEEIARPASLADEIRQRFGPYPADEWTYGFTWPSRAKTETAGASLVAAVNRRSEIAQWLFAERFPDWDLGIVVIGEYHSVIEPMWHGIDPDHPLHGQPSGPAAKAAVESVYEAGDRMLGALMDRFPDVRLIAFSMHGMGANHADIASMVLLPELLYRAHFGRPLLAEDDWDVTTAGVPILDADANWEMSILNGFPGHKSPIDRMQRRVTRMARLLGLAPRPQFSLDWMPAAHYQRYWPQMPAFALPSYYDGAVRLNLAGRERNGVVQPESYEEVCTRVENLVRECSDPISGKPITAEFIRQKKGMFDVTSSESDLLVNWDTAPLGLNHPTLGKIGPFPYRRTGGHTGKSGVAYFSDRDGVEAVEEASSFDVVPTIIELLGKEPLPGVSGRSFVTQ